MSPVPDVKPSLVLVLVGAGLLVAGFQLTNVGGPAEFDHRVERISSSEYENAVREYGDFDRTVVYRFSDFTAETQAVVRRAIDSPGRSEAVYGTDRKPPEFSYPGDHSGPGLGRYYLEYGGEHYELRTRADRGFGLGDLFLGVFCWVPGVALTSLGLWRYGSPDVTVSVLVGSGAFAVFSFVPFNWFGLDGPGPLVGAGFLVWTLLTVLTWILLHVLAPPEESATDGS